MRNTSDKTLYADATQGWFGTVKKMGGEQFFAQSEPSWPLWTSGIEHPIDSWNGNPFFVPIQPGETKTFTVLHVVAASDLADPRSRTTTATPLTAVAPRQRTASAL
ncbi:MAG: hypothetical protein ACLSVD_12335 [Eggerthellaceae bacterium]